MRYLIVFFIACATPAADRSAPARPQADQAVLGDTLAIESKLLRERRTINIYLPPDYATTDHRYPVLYMPDGGMNEDFPHVVGSVDVSIKNAVIRPVIVVGIQNTERRRDLVGPTVVADEQKAAPNAGGADRFRAFLRDELKPMIEQRYRTTRESAIVGESLAGLFVVETLLVEPALFDRYIAADPSVWWNEHALVRDVSVHLARHGEATKTLYVATSSEADPAVSDVVTRLRRDSSIDVTYEPMPNERHGTIYPTAALRGIRIVFAAD